MTDLISPINKSAWQSASDGLLALPPPNGPYPQDCIVMMDAVRPVLYNSSNVRRGNGRLGVLGLTYEMIETAKCLQREWSEHGRILDIDVIDCRAFSPTIPRAHLSFKEGNWLTWEPEAYYDVVIGDDVLCNIAYQDMPLFFKNVASMLTSRGAFITRTTGIFSQCPPPTSNETIERLQSSLPDIKKAVDTLDPTSRKAAWDGLLYEIAWPMMHSLEAGYDPISHRFDTSIWNKLVGNPWDCPLNSLSENLKMTSIASATLCEMSYKFFLDAKGWPVHSIWEEAPFSEIPEARHFANHFKNHYLIMAFNK